jgi:hypothetical protein
MAVLSLKLYILPPFYPISNILSTDFLEKHKIWGDSSLPADGQLFQEERRQKLF